jgi:hypothetical protein
MDARASFSGAAAPSAAAAAASAASAASAAAAASAAGAISSAEVTANAAIRRTPCHPDAQAQCASGSSVVLSRPSPAAFKV